MSSETLFDLPSSPDEIGVLLPPADLRRIRFSALDFQTARRAIVEYIQSYFPDDFNDFVAQNGIIMLLEIVAGEVAKLSLRADMIAGECFLPTCTTSEALDNHLALINQRIRRQTAATADIELSVATPVTTNIEINAGTRIQIRGSDAQPLIYEVYAAPGDYTSKIVLPAGKRGIIAWGIEGAFASSIVFVSSGGNFQTFTITDVNMLESPILVTVQTGQVKEEWLVITDAIEKFNPNDKVVEVVFAGENATFRFGNDVTGRALLSGQQVTIRYRAGGGMRGRVGTNQLVDTWSITPLPPANAVVQVSVRNTGPSIGGTDRESLEQAKRRAPREFAVDRSITTQKDYAQIASYYTHPVFGSVVKAVATLRSSLNANLVELYCLALGANGQLATPSTGLKLGLKTYIDDLNVATDYIEVKDGALKPVDLEISVAISINTDATVVKSKVEEAITAFFDSGNWEMGEPLYVSNLVDVIERIDGILFVDMFSPPDNILPTKQLADPNAFGIGFNELIVEGRRNIRYYYESNRQ